MHSYEDRIRAVKLYIWLGKSAGPTIRKLGYPTKNSLKGWCREYEQERDLQVGYVRSRRKYSAEQPPDEPHHSGGASPSSTIFFGHRHMLARRKPTLPRQAPCQQTLRAPKRPKRST